MNFFTEIAGHSKQIQQLQQALLTQKLGQAYILVGRQGIGRKKVALAVAQSLLCEKILNTKSACGVCPSCLRVKKIQHEGLLVISPESTQIKIDQAHQVIDFLSLQKISAARIVIIEEAQLLNPQAANALLKILEEPPKDTYFFLLSSSLSAMLPTIRSRCQAMHFQALGEAEMKKYIFSQLSHPLHEVDLSKQEWLLRSARGSFSSLQELLQDSLQDSRHQALALILSMSELAEGADFLSQTDWRDFFKDRKQALQIAVHVQSFLRDALGLALKMDAKNWIMNADQEEDLQKLALKPIPILQKLAWGFLQIEKGLQAFRDGTLMLEELYVSTHRMD
ncbi:MAG: DNA polymerase III subunit delta' [Pseudobdellovibrionaceae bacterium]